MTRSRTRRRTTLVLATAIAAPLVLSSCGYQSAAPGQIGVVVDGYAIIPTDPVITGCIESETSQNEITNDVYFYPARQISWDATGEAGSERGPYTVVSNREAPAELNVPVVVTMDLTNDCELLAEFHRNLGTKYNGWLNDDGSVSEGWLALLNYVVG